MIIIHVTFQPEYIFYIRACFLKRLGHAILGNFVNYEL